MEVVAAAGGVEVVAAAGVVEVVAAAGVEVVVAAAGVEVVVPGTPVAAAAGSASANPEGLRRVHDILNALCVGPMSSEYRGTISVLGRFPALHARLHPDVGCMLLGTADDSLADPQLMGPFREHRGLVLNVSNVENVCTDEEGITVIVSMFELRLSISLFWFFTSHTHTIVSVAF